MGLSASFGFPSVVVFCNSLLGSSSSLFESCLRGYGTYSRSVLVQFVCSSRTAPVSRICSLALPGCRSGADIDGCHCSTLSRYCESPFVKRFSSILINKFLHFSGGCDTRESHFPFCVRVFFAW